MSINLTDAMDFLLSNGYIYRYGERFKFHNKLYLEMAGQQAKAGIHHNPQAVDWVRAYTKFITEARVPARGEDTRGGYYSLNKYSEPGMKAFRKAIEGGANYDALVLSTSLYYRSGVRLKVAVSRYMEEGLWRGDYDAHIASVEAGNQQQHEQQTVSDGTHTAWSVG